MAQELSTKMMGATKENEARPFDTVKIYATDVSRHLKAGEELEVHPLLAEQLIKDGKATKTAPKAK